MAIDPEHLRVSARDFDGSRIKHASPLENGERCIILLDPDSNRDSIFRNLICIDQNRSVIWKAQLPSSPDVFLDFQLTREGVLARTWSGFNLLLDQENGRELSRIFAK